VVVPLFLTSLYEGERPIMPMIDRPIMPMIDVYFSKDNAFSTTAEAAKGRALREVVLVKATVAVAKCPVDCVSVRAQRRSMCARVG
jgi:hypothetical protein